MRSHSKHSRSGLTTIVTSAIMLAAIAIMGSGVVMWGNTSIFGSERILASSYSDKVNKINEDLVIEKIWYNTNPQFVNITLNNQGNVGLNVTQIQFSTTSKTNQFHFGNQTILPQKSGSIKISYGYVHNILTNVIITTTRGSIFSTQVLPP